MRSTKVSVSQVRLLQTGTIPDRSPSSAHLLYKQAPYRLNHCGGPYLPWLHQPLRLFAHGKSSKVSTRHLSCGHMRNLTTAVVKDVQCRAANSAADSQEHSVAEPSTRLELRQRSNTGRLSGPGRVWMLRGWRQKLKLDNSRRVVVCSNALHLYGTTSFRLT
jgi:hypothetical protein